MFKKDIKLSFQIVIPDLSYLFNIWTDSYFKHNIIMNTMNKNYRIQKVLPSSIYVRKIILWLTSLLYIIWTNIIRVSWLILVYKSNVIVTPTQNKNEHSSCLLDQPLMNGRYTERWRWLLLQNVQFVWRFLFLFIFILLLFNY